MIINDHRVEDLEQLCADLLMITYTQLGQTPDKESVLILTQTLASDLKQDFKSLTWNDVQRAFRKGVRDGDFFHVNIPNIYKWLRAWRNIKWDAIHQLDQGKDKNQIPYFINENKPKLLT